MALKLEITQQIYKSKMFNCNKTKALPTIDIDS